MNSIAEKIDEFTEKKKFYFSLFIFYFIMTFFIFAKYIKRDLLALNSDGLGYLNIFYFIRQSISEGQLPLWNPLMNAGKPFITDFTNCFFYPIRLLFQFLDTKWFFYSFYSWHLAFGATFFTLYLREIKCSKWVSVLMSLAYYFSVCVGGYRKAHLLIITTIVWLPAILYFIEKYYNTKKTKFLYVSSLLMAIQFLSGFPQDALYTDIIAGLYIIALEIRYKFPFVSWYKTAILWGLFYIGFALIGLIPFAEMAKVYSTGGSIGMSLGQFRSYSLNPVKLIMMLCPTIFNRNPIGAIPQMGFAELQSEVFLGTATFTLLVYALIKHIKDKQICMFFLFMAGATLYACCGEIEFLAKIFYRVPILGSLRCASRILFVSAFFGLAIASLALSKIVEEKKFDLLIKISIWELAFILFIYIADVSFASLTASNAVMYAEINGRFIKTLNTLAVLIAIFLLLQKFKRLQISAVCLVVALIVLDTYPYWRQSHFYNMKKFGVDTEDEAFLVKHKDEGKVLLANPYIDGEYKSAIGTSFAFSLGVQGINSFTTMNNPKLSKLLTSEDIMQPQFNFSGLYTGFPEVQKNMEQDNDLLSMLGIRYIIDQEGLVPTGKAFRDKTNIIKVNKTLVEVPRIDIVKSKNVEVYQYEVAIKPNKEYRISFDYTGNGKIARLFYVDLYGGAAYDRAEQQKDIMLKPNVPHYSYIMDSGDIPENVNQILVRIVTKKTVKDFSINNFKVEEVELGKKPNPYKKVFESGKVKIYENQNYKPLIYSVNKVEKLDNPEDIYGHNEDFDFDDVSYIYGLETEKYAPAEITNMKFNGNEASATVVSDGKAFVNFSQTYFPGWRAYIDGKRVKLYEVNGYIQGCEVPAGRHKVKFKYIPFSLIIGMIGTLVTFAIWLTVILKRQDV